jgi:hypothetical protein
VSDWTYQNPEPKLRMNSADSLAVSVVVHRHVDAHHGLDRPRYVVATNRFNQMDKFLGLKQFKPTDVGLPVLPRRVLLDARRLHAARRSASAATRASAADCRDGDTATHIQGSRR